MAPEANKPDYESRLMLYRDNKPFRDVIEVLPLVEEGKSEPGAESSGA